MPLTTTKTRTAITAIPAGRDRRGFPLRRRGFLIDRAPEPFGQGRSRIFAENRSVSHPNGRHVFTPVVVLTESIEYVQIGLGR